MASATRKSGTFTATGAGAEALGLNAQVIITGTFNATVAVQVKDQDGNWANVATHTAPVGIKYEMAVGTPWRLNCTAYTSGTVTWELIAVEPFVV